MMQLKCLVCVAEHKMHAQTIGAHGEPPEQRDALTICATPLGPVTPICYEHLEVARQSAFLTPAPSPIPQHFLGG